MSLDCDPSPDSQLQCPDSQYPDGQAFDSQYPDSQCPDSQVFEPTVQFDTHVVASQAETPAFGNSPPPLPPVGDCTTTDEEGDQQAGCISNPEMQRDSARLQALNAGEAAAGSSAQATSSERMRFG